MMRYGRLVLVWLDGAWVVVPDIEARIPGVVHRITFADGAALAVRMDRGYKLFERKEHMDFSGPTKEVPAMF